LKLISIFGCGWIGLPLAKVLIEKGYSVKGSTTTKEKTPLLSDLGIIPFLIDFKEEEIPEAMLQSDIWVIAFPPQSRKTDSTWYWQAIEKLSDLANQHKVKKIIMLSSTSVYPDVPNTVSEDMELTEENCGNLSIIKAENALLKLENTALCILRLGGLAGYDRIMSRHFAGKEGLVGGKHPTNLVHRDDVLQVIVHMVEKEFGKELYNVCCIEHPTREELYTYDCKRMHWPLPVFVQDEEVGKTICSKKIHHEVKFLYSNPKDFKYNNIN
jgi:nucleoside-diphosphate-sugar epimerase